MLLNDRQQAGKILAQKLIKYQSDRPLVLALPRGGLPIGLEIAKTLQAPLNVIIARKLGAPRQREFGIGAIAEENVKLLDQRTIKLLNISKRELNQITLKESQELKRRIKAYRQNQPLPDLKDQTVILVDDGLATGLTAKAVITTVKKHHPKKIIVAFPVCALDSVQNLQSLVDEVVCIATPLEFLAVGHWYRHFPQLSDQEVVKTLAEAKQTASNHIGYESHSTPGVIKSSL